MLHMFWLHFYGLLNGLQGNQSQAFSQDPVQNNFKTIHELAYLYGPKMRNGKLID